MVELNQNKLILMKKIVMDLRDGTELLVLCGVRVASVHHATLLSTPQTKYSFLIISKNM